MNRIIYVKHNIKINNNNISLCHNECKYYDIKKCKLFEEDIIEKYRCYSCTKHYDYISDNSYINS
jgi:hypothetical protein